VNPCDEAGMAQAIRDAVVMPRAERTARMRRLREGIRREDVFWWMERFLDDAGMERVPRAPAIAALKPPLTAAAAYSAP